MKTPTLALAALAAVMLSAAAAPAVAADNQKGTASLSYNDLDLGTSAGRAALAQRFDQAAREKCGVSDDKAMKGSAKYCYRNTSEQYRHYVADILRDFDSKKADTGLAVR